jgi:hypothetical protein
MSEFLVHIKTTLSWSATEVSETIEQEFPGWKVEGFCFVNDSKKVLQAMIELGPNRDIEEIE